MTERSKFKNMEPTLPKGGMGGFWSFNWLRGVASQVIFVKVRQKDQQRIVESGFLFKGNWGSNMIVRKGRLLNIL